MITKYEHKAAVLKALSHPARLEILEILLMEQQCNCDMAALLNLEQSTLSRHISVLKQAGFVTTSKQGVRLIVQIANPVVKQLLASVDEAVCQTMKSRQKLLTEL